MKDVEKTKSRRMDSIERLPSDKSTKETAIARLNEILTESLAAYVFLRSKELPSKVINDLCRIEIEAAHLIKSFYSGNKEINLKGSLASVISFIPNGNKQNMEQASNGSKEFSYQTLKEIQKIASKK